MKHISVTEVSSQFRHYLTDCEHEPVIVSDHGKPLAVLLSLVNQDALERLILAYSPTFQAILEASRQDILETGGIRHADFWREFEL
jgi:prevent-host-death family protein